MKFVPLCLCCVLVLLSAGPSRADTITLNPEIDNTIYETAFNLSNGIGESVFVGNNAVWQPRRALLRFSLEGIPQDSEITGVRLELQLTKSASTGTDELSLHRLMRLWGEGLSDAGAGGIGNGEGDGVVAEDGDATWSHAFYATEEWTTVGGDFAPSESASAAVASDPGAYTWESTPQMVADVQGWLDDPQSNAGWIIIGDEISNRSARVFSSKDHLDPSQWPKLIVEFTPLVSLEEESMGEVKAGFVPRKE